MGVLQQIVFYQKSKKRSLCFSHAVYAKLHAMIRFNEDRDNLLDKDLKISKMDEPLAAYERLELSRAEQDED